MAHAGGSVANDIVVDDITVIGADLPGTGDRVGAVGQRRGGVRDEPNLTHGGCRLVEVGCDIDAAEQRIVGLGERHAHRAFVVGILVELNGAVLRNGLVDEMRHDHVIEKVAQCVLAVLRAATDIFCRTIDIALKIVGVAVIFEHGRRVQPMALHAEFLQQRVGLDPALDVHIVGGRERLGHVNAKLHGAQPHNVDLALHILAVTLLDGGGQFGQRRVLKRRLGIAGPTLERAEIGPGAGEHEVIIFLPFGGQIDIDMEKLRGRISRPYMVANRNLVGDRDSKDGGDGVGHHRGLEVGQVARDDEIGGLQHIELRGVVEALNGLLNRAALLAVVIELQHLAVLGRDTIGEIAKNICAKILSHRTLAVAERLGDIDHQCLRIDVREIGQVAVIADCTRFLYAKALFVKLKCRRVAAQRVFHGDILRLVDETEA